MASASKDRIAPAVVITEGGEKIGFVGAKSMLGGCVSSAKLYRFGEFKAARPGLASH